MAKRNPHCLVCNRERKKEECLSFFVVDGEAHLDLKGQFFNPNSCVCRTEACLCKAVRFDLLKSLGQNHLDEQTLSQKQTQFLAQFKNEQQEKLKHLLSLGYRASYLACGRVASSISIKKGKALALLLAKDLAQHTQKEMLKLAKHFNCPSYYVLDKESLGQVTRQDERACVSVENEAYLAGLKPYLVEEIK